ncbi:peptidoglycan DD-metalloendopeptidase family protein [Candidatus Berkiella cookevillensis]|uniref:Murein hydrolase activator NlpD n=1 Tax=Candidatus Berkiella cookevillensis TaxID=437022 RepID=A0A0Q9YV97_9GAMM|nr:peptidoglycan DD-metalloendopeptidase family protein [Candidatus Berkiella cookevillensis]MCS5708388.1 peptidoglycan DD-metalloendopeptidase family protein [Candidatus Berkiella cookevillensis]
MSLKIKKIISISVLAMLSAGCFSSKIVDPAPVYSLPIKAESVPEFHTVKEGESLYTVAWIYDLDYHKIASNNYLSSKASIYPGQKIYLKRPAPVHGARPIAQQSIEIRPVNAKPQQATIDQKPVNTSSVAKTPTPATSSTQPANQAAKPASVAINNNQKNNAQWLWPTNAKITKLFSVKEQEYNKGIDFSGNLNDPIYATKAGKVVYSGEGLRGYGKLIIIKHDELYLSAYAHNNELLVREGDEVAQGKIIARMGKTDSPHVKLHFQIRKNGQPVDPSGYLKVAAK